MTDSTQALREMVAERLRDRREKAMISQVELAYALMIDRRTYSSYERAYRLPGPDMLIRLARFHEVSVDYLLGLTDYTKPYPDKVWPS